MNYFYTAYGLSICSSFAIPELLPIDHSLDVDTCDVCIRTIAHGTRVETSFERFYWTGIGSYWVRDGREILLTPAPGAAEPAVRLILLGSVFGALLHQRVYITLHASAVAIPDRNDTVVAVGFMGDSRQGKSTMAAAFHAQGHRAVADDLIAIPARLLHADDPQPSARPVPIYPGFPTLKLWPDATAEIFGIAEPEQPAPFASYTPRRVRDVRRHFSAEELLLKRLYVLMDAREASNRGAASSASRLLDAGTGTRPEGDASAPMCCVGAPRRCVFP
jgi:hypothetical protein